jgi:WW domain-containing oxidoreductase
MVSGLIGFLSRPSSKNIPEGAATSCYVAVRPELAGITGQYFDNCTVAEPSRPARDEASSERLWEVSEQLTGLR